MKKTTRTLGVLASFSLTLFLSSCYNDEIKDAVSENVSFANDIQPIFNANCVSCHPSDALPDLSPGNSYTSLLSMEGIVPGDADGSELMEMLNFDPEADNPMPPGGAMSSKNINLIRDWINQGALNN
uniref:hypothetical protein n=1 Tax=Mariniflexile sp. TaxID=1979402 RepID=UPI0040488350